MVLGFSLLLGLSSVNSPAVAQVDPDPIVVSPAPLPPASYRATVFCDPATFKNCTDTFFASDATKHFTCSGTVQTNSVACKNNENDQVLAPCFFAGTRIPDVGDTPDLRDKYVCKPNVTPPQQPGQRHQQQAAEGLEVTQSNEQNVKSGDSSQTFNVTGWGDNSDACQGPQGIDNTGNAVNDAGVLQYASDGSIDTSGGNFTLDPSSATSCNQQVNQAASASGI